MGSFSIAIQDSVLLCHIVSLLLLLPAGLCSADFRDSVRLQNEAWTSAEQSIGGLGRWNANPIVFAVLPKSNAFRSMRTRARSFLKLRRWYYVAAYLSALIAPPPNGY